MHKITILLLTANGNLESLWLRSTRKGAEGIKAKLLELIPDLYVTGKWPVIGKNIKTNENWVRVHETEEGRKLIISVVLVDTPTK